VNWEHLKAFLWLRWRIISNRNRRAGKGAVILQALFTVIMIAGGIAAFVVGIAVGYLALPKAPPAVFLYVWDGVVVAFLFLWMVELMIELQRAELLSLDKFLHLPVSLSGAFLINYLGSISGFGATAILPLMIGLAIGLVFSKGAIMLLLFPLIAAFALMVTALTHQFRGWLASLMMNKRRRRTVVMVVTFVFMGMTQIPNIIGFTSGWGRRPGTALSEASRKELDKLNIARAKKEITRDEHRARRRELEAPARAENAKQTYQLVRSVNTFVPLGWLPYGATEGFEGSAWPALLGIAGLSVIGIVSLRRSYVTTLQLYTGHYSGKFSGSGGARPTPAAPVLARPGETSTAPPKKYPAALLERRFPGVNEYAAVVAVASFRSLMRAPEAKMMLLSPVIMLFVFGSMFMFRTSAGPALMTPLMAAGGHAFMLIMLVGVLGNQFGFDRSAFKVFVLSPAPRKDILLGKNMAAAPLGIGFMFISALAIQIFSPMRVDHYLAVLLQMIPMYLIFSMVGNVLSIIAPMAMAVGSMKPVKPRAKIILIHMAFMLVFPIALAATLIPLGIEFILTWTGTFSWVPAYLVFTLIETALVIWLYIEMLEVEGRLLERRELKVLEAVTTKVE
jgi:ABC-2 type transport system permease protein